MKKALSLMLSVSLLFGAMAFGLTAAAEKTPTLVAEGYCGGEGDGTNLSWTLDSEGTLTISGTGEAQPYTAGNLASWADYRDLITSVAVENGVTKMRDDLFFTCNHIESITLPSTLQRFAISNYFGFNQLTSIDVDPDNPYMKSVDGVLLSKDGRELLAYPVGRHFVVIPDGVTSIGSFYGSSIVSVVIPEGVERIEHGVFSECFDLTRLSIPLSMKVVDDAAFYETFTVSIVEYHGTQEQWDQIEIVLNDSAPTITNYKLHNAYQAYAEGHDVVFEERTTKEPTCLTAGEKEWMYRITPGTDWIRFTYFELSEEIAPLGHSWGEWEVVKQATPDEEGLMRRVCANDPSHVEEQVIHRYEEDENGEPTSAIREFIARITSFMKGIIDWFLRLFRRP